MSEEVETEGKEEVEGGVKEETLDYEDDEDIERLFDDILDGDDDTDKEDKKEDNKEDDDDKEDEDESDDEEEDDKEIDDEIGDILKELDDEEIEKAIRETPKFDAEASDEEIADTMYQTADHQEYLRSAREAGVKLDDRFLALTARHNIDPDFLNKHELYSLEDFQNKIETMEERLDPEAIYFPKNGTKEELADFYEKNEGIPRDIEGYNSSIFEDTVYENWENDEEKKDFLQYWMGDMSLSQEQAKLQAQKVVSRTGISRSTVI